MKNIDFLEVYNNGGIKLQHFNKNILEYKSNTPILDFNELRKLSLFFNEVDKKFGNSKFITIFINYTNKLKFSDKLTYILLECLLYYELIIKNRKVRFNIDKVEKNILIEGVYDSCLRYISSPEEYKKKFEDHVSRLHYRKLVTLEACQSEPQTISMVSSTINPFLKNCGISEDHTGAVSEIVAELIDNAIEHGRSDCLVDINVTDDYNISEDHNYNIPEDYIKKCFFAVSIAVVDFSKDLLGKKIGEKLNEEIGNNENYSKLRRIKKLHESYFCDKYTIEDFYMMSAFQNKITSRDNSVCSGGKGLTMLIERLQESSLQDICYVVSGNRCLFFLKDQIKQDNEKWVGFNKENNYNNRPNFDAIRSSPLNIYGTSYNLTFIFKKEN